MKYYEIRDLNGPTDADGYGARLIDEDELDRRLNVFRQAGITLDDCKYYLLHGNIKEADPWEEWAEELKWALFDGDDTKIKAALLKLRGLVEKEG